MNGRLTKLEKPVDKNSVVVPSEGVFPVDVVLATQDCERGR